MRENKICLYGSMARAENITTVQRTKAKKEW